MLPLAKRVLATVEKVMGSRHSNTGFALSQLAGVYQGQARFAEAEALYKRSLAILEKELSPDHPVVGTVLSVFAALYEKQGRLAEAEALLTRMFESRTAGIRFMGSGPVVIQQSFRRR